MTEISLKLYPILINIIIIIIKNNGKNMTMKCFTIMIDFKIIEIILELEIQI